MIGTVEEETGSRRVSEEGMLFRTRSESVLDDRLAIGDRARRGRGNWYSWEDMGGAGEMERRRWRAEDSRGRASRSYITDVGGNGVPYSTTQMASA